MFLRPVQGHLPPAGRPLQAPGSRQPQTPALGKGSATPQLELGARGGRSTMRRAHNLPRTQVLSTQTAAATALLAPPFKVEKQQPCKGQSRAQATAMAGGDLCSQVFTWESCASLPRRGLASSLALGSNPQQTLRADPPDRQTLCCHPLLGPWDTHPGPGERSVTAYGQSWHGQPSRPLPSPSSRH